MQAVTYWAANWHAYGPAKFNGLDVFSDQTPVFRDHRFKPLSDWFVFCFRLVEDRWDALLLNDIECTMYGTFLCILRYELC